MSYMIVTWYNYHITDGGVAIYVNKNLEYRVVEKMMSDEWYIW